MMQSYEMILKGVKSANGFYRAGGDRGSMGLWETLFESIFAQSSRIIYIVPKSNAGFEKSEQLR